MPLADSGWYLTIPLIVAGCGLGLLVSQLNNYTLSPISDERVSEAAGVNSAAGSFGLSFGLAFAGAIMLATLAHVHHARRRQHGALRREQEQVSTALEDDAELMSNTGSRSSSSDEPRRGAGRDHRASTPTPGPRAAGRPAGPDPRRPLGILNAFRMRRLPDPEPSAAVEGTMLG